MPPAPADTASSDTAADTPTPAEAAAHRRYWRQNLRTTAGLLAAWLSVTCVVGFWASDLNFQFFGWPFSFWLASQGALLVYCVIIWAYARRMNRLDQEFGPDDEG